MSFFEPPPRMPRREEPFEPEPEPPWERGPDNVLGGVVPLQLLLARSETVAVTITDVVAYRSGFSFELGSIRRGPFDRTRMRRRRLDMPFEPRYDSEGELSPDFLRSASRSPTARR